MSKGETMKKFGLVAIGLIFLLSLFSVYCTARVAAEEPSNPHPANAIWAEPSIVNLDVGTINVGYKFNVTVWLNLSVPSYSWEFKLTYNTTYLNMSNFAFTAANITSQFFEGHGTVPTTDIDDAQGYVHFGETLLGVDSREAGYGSLVWVEFNVTELPEVNTTLVFEFVPEDTFVLDPDLNDVEPSLQMLSSTLPVVPEFPYFILLIAIIPATLTAIALIKKKYI